jgi:hypothetical protein
VTEPSLPRLRLQYPRDEFQKSCLARAVRTDESDLVIAFYDEVQRFVDEVVVVTETDTRQLGNDPSRTRGLGEGEVHDSRSAVRDLDGIHTLQHLDPALHLARLGVLVPEPAYESLHRLPLPCLVLGRRGRLLRGELTLLHERFVVARIGDQLPIPDLDDLGRDPVDEVAVVRDKEDRAFVDL